MLKNSYNKPKVLRSLDLRDAFKYDGIPGIRTIIYYYYKPVAIYTGGLFGRFVGYDSRGNC